MTASFGSRLAVQFAAQRHLCVGIDPHTPMLHEWGLGDDAAGAEHMGREVVAAASGVAACVKPQVSFFERFGAAGFSALERVLADARAAGLMVIADVKRGDIGSSFRAYADAWLLPGSPLEVDAMTAAAYMGFESLSGAETYVRSHGKGLFVLAATSNPEAREVQRSRRDDGRTVAGAMVADARAWNDAFLEAGTQAGAGAATEAAAESATAVGSVGVVLGATLDLADFGISIDGEQGASVLPILAPGFGHQGARIENARDIFGSIGGALLANESRSILAGGPVGLADRIAARAAAIATALA